MMTYSNSFDQRIEQHLSRLNTAVICVSAPKGYDKTATISRWVSNLGCKTVWLTMTSDDKDPAQFLAHLKNEIITVFGRKSEIENLTDVELIPGLITVLSQYKDEQIIFVFDQYERALSVNTSLTVNTVLSSLPQNFRTIIITNMRPNLPLSYGRFKNQINTVSFSDLALSFDEVCQIFKDNSINLSAQELLTIYVETEGWPAGVRMIASYLQNSDHTDFSSYIIKDFPYIYDFFMEEIFQAQPDDIQEFLLQTSGLDFLNASICNAITGSQDSARIIEFLERNNLFLVPLDNDHTWYRYHNLFRKVLISKAKKIIPDQLSMCYQHASEWYLEHGHTDLALGSSLRTNNDEYIVSLLERSLYTVLVDGNPNNILEAFNNKRLKRKIDKRFLLKTASALKYLYVGNLEKFELFFKAWEGTYNNLDTQEEYHLGYLYLQILRIFLICNSAEPSESLLEDAEKLINDCQIYSELFPIALTAKAYVLEKQNKWDLCLPLYGTCSNLSRDTAVHSFIIARIVSLTLKQGDLDHAEKACKTFLREQSKTRPAPFAKNAPFTAVIYALYARILCERNDLKSVDFYIQKSLDGAVGEYLTYEHALIFINAAKIQLSLGHFDKAILFLELAENTLFGEKGTPFDGHLNQVVDALRARCMLYTGNLLWCEKWAEKTYRDHERRKKLHSSVLFSLCQVLVELKNFHQAKVILDFIQEQTSRTITLKGNLRMNILLALYCNETDNRAGALDALLAAIDCASDHGYFRVFYEYGSRLQTLLQEVLKLSGCKSDAQYQYILKLLGENSTQPPSKNFSTNTDNAASGYTDISLTSRETEVLRLICQGYSNKEISKDLFISDNTTKKHLKNIFSKLQVNNRSQAIIESQRLKLI